MKIIKQVIWVWWENFQIFIMLKLPKSVSLDICTLIWYSFNALNSYSEKLRLLFFIPSGHPMEHHNLSYASIRLKSFVKGIRHFVNAYLCVCVNRTKFTSYLAKIRFNLVDYLIHLDTIFLFLIKYFPIHFFFIL